MLKREITLTFFIFQLFKQKKCDKTKIHVLFLKAHCILNVSAYIKHHLLTSLYFMSEPKL